MHKEFIPKKIRQSLLALHPLALPWLPRARKVVGQRGFEFVVSILTLLLWAKVSSVWFDCWAKTNARLSWAVPRRAGCC